MNRSWDERPNPCQLIGIKYELFQANSNYPIVFQEYPTWSQGSSTKTCPRSSDIYTMNIIDIVRMLQISDHQAEEIHAQGHHHNNSCQFWSFKEYLRRYLIILDSIYTMPVNILSFYLLSYTYPELPGVTNFSFLFYFSLLHHMVILLLYLILSSHSHSHGSH
jgi:hypothetical protein